MTSVDPHPRRKLQAAAAVTQTHHLDPSECLVLINAAFLQEIKDSNPNLWLAAAELRALCETEDWNPEDSAQSLIKRFVRALGEIRDLLSLQFGLEESYGYLKTAAPPPQLGIFATDSGESQAQLHEALEQHRRLYLDLCDLIEQSEELQYRGCDRTAVVSFAEQVAHFTREMTRHERLEAELIEREL